MHFDDGRVTKQEIGCSKLIDKIISSLLLTRVRITSADCGKPPPSREDITKTSYEFFHFSNWASRVLQI